MTFLEMQTMVRGVLSDPSAAQYSDVFIKSLLNLSAQDIFNRIVGVNERHFLSNATVTWVPGTELYNVPTGFKRAVLVERTDQAAPYNLNPADVTRKNEYSNQQSIFYTPRHVYWFYANQIGFSPIPNTTGTIKVWYVKAYVVLSGDADVLPGEWNAENHEVVVWGAITRASRRSKETGALYNDIYKGLLEQLLNDVQERQVQETRMVEPPVDAEY